MRYVRNYAHLQHMTRFQSLSRIALLMLQSPLFEMIRALALDGSCIPFLVFLGGGFKWQNLWTFVEWLNRRVTTVTSLEFQKDETRTVSPYSILDHALVYGRRNIFQSILTCYHRQTTVSHQILFVNLIPYTIMKYKIRLSTLVTSSTSTNNHKQPNQTKPRVSINVPQKRYGIVRINRKEKHHPMQPRAVVLRGSNPGLSNQCTK